MIHKEYELNQKIIHEYLQSLSKKFHKDVIILFDADRTLYKPDASRILNKMAKIDLAEIKDGFLEHGYSYPGFFNMVQVYSEIKRDDYIGFCQSIASEIDFYHGVQSFIEKAQQRADIFCVSSGIKGILENLFKRHGLTNVPIIAGSHNEFDDFLIGRSEKGFICEYFQSMGKKIFAFGDTDVDTLMLQKADHAVVVVNHKHNQDLISKLQDHPSLFQISYTDFWHQNVKKTSYASFYQTFDLLTNKG